MIGWKNWFKIFLVFLVPIFFDQMLKLLTRGLHTEAVMFGWLGFFANFSDAEIYSNLPNKLQEIKGLTLAVVGICLFQLNILVNFLFALSHTVRYSISLILGGSICFLMDKIFHGQVINNLAITFNSQQFFGFNLAILFICAGVILLALILIVKPQELLSPTSVRKTLLTDHVNQRQFIISIFSFFTIVYYVLSTLIGLYTYITITSVTDSRMIQTDVIQYFCLLVLALYCLLTPLVYTTSVALSHRVYGPVYGFQNYMRMLFEKKEKVTSSFKTRKKDHFKELENIAEYIRTRIIRKL